jgi:hypothetical protein
MGTKKDIEIRFLTDVAVIYLTQGQVAIVDNYDVSKIDSRCWFAHRKGKKGAFYAGGNSKSVNGKRMTLSMHREVMGADDNLEIDHINHNTLDNRRSNLRIANPIENSYNREMNKNNTTGYKGVGYHKRSEKWMAYIGVSWRLKYLGYFTDPADAALAYDKAAREHYG